MIRPHPTSTLFPYTTLFRSLIFTNGYTCDLLLPINGCLEIVYFLPCSIHGFPPKGENRISFLSSEDRKSTRLNSSHGYISYAVFCLKKKNNRSTQRSNLYLV